MLTLAFREELHVLCFCFVHKISVAGSSEKHSYLKAQFAVYHVMDRPVYTAYGWKIRSPVQKSSGVKEMPV